MTKLERTLLIILAEFVWFVIVFLSARAIIPLLYGWLS